MKNDLGKILKQERIKAGLTQRQVYEKLGIPQSTFSSWERGASQPTPARFLELCEMYGIKDIFKTFGYEDLDNNLELSNDEETLIENYRILNPSQKETIGSLIEHIAELEKALLRFQVPKPVYDDLIDFKLKRGETQKWAKLADNLDFSPNSLKELIRATDQEIARIITKEQDDIYLAAASGSKDMDDDQREKMNLDIQNILEEDNED